MTLLMNIFAYMYTHTHILFDPTESRRLEKRGHWYPEPISKLCLFPLTQSKCNEKSLVDDIYRRDIGALSPNVLK